MSRPIAVFAAASLAVLSPAACSRPAEKAAAPAAEHPAEEKAVASAKVEIPAGDYTLDKSHSTLVFKLSHLGMSQYTAQFTDFDAKLRLDPANLAATAIEVDVDPKSLSLPNPPDGFKAELLGADWLDAERWSTITYRSTSVQPAEADTALIIGELTLHGVTKPLVLQAKFNGGYAGHPMDPNARAGFSATGSFKRSDFGMGFGVPEPGSKMGVGDEVQLVIETEFTGPPLKATQAKPQ